MKILSLLDAIIDTYEVGLTCHTCRRSVFRCECGYAIAAIAIAVIAAAGTAYSMYAQNEAQQQAASAAKKSAQMQADAEAQAGEARARAIQYNADKIHKSFLSREAGAGVQVGQGSLLETEGQFAFDTEYSKQLAKYPHELAGASDRYQSDLFGFQKRQLASQQIAGSVIGGVSAGAGSLSKSYGSLAARSPSSYDPGNANMLN